MFDPKLIFSCSMIVPNVALAMAGIINYWTGPQKIPPAVWIAIFIFLPLLFNFLNVRRYGEVEYWITMIKILTLLALMLLGLFFLPLRATTGQPLLGTNGTAVVPCSESSEPCISWPGFACSSLEKSAYSRLERRPDSRVYRRWYCRPHRRLLGMFLQSGFRVYWPRVSGNHSHGSRKSQKEYPSSRSKNRETHYLLLRHGGHRTELEHVCK